MITAQTLDRITHFDGSGLPVVSLYLDIPVDPGQRNALDSRVSSLLDQVRACVHDPTLDRLARFSVRDDIDRIQDAAEVARWRPGATAIFSCTRGGLFEQVALPHAVHEQVVVDVTPWVRPMLAVLDESYRVCVAVVDRKSAQIWELYQDEIAPLDRVRDRVLRKPNYAGRYGLDEYRIRNHAQTLTQAHYRRTAELLREHFDDGGYQLLIVGGHQAELPRFVEALPTELQKIVVGTFSADPNAATEADIRCEATAIAERFERERERRQVDEIFGVAAGGGPAVLGVDACLWAGSLAAVRTLLLQDATMVQGVVCERSACVASSGDICALCGGKTRPTADVLDELAMKVIDGGGAVVHIRAETQLRHHVAAARLRFPLPPQPGHEFGRGSTPE
jgi:peptide subunit release factor 1 (eRF1)